ncbi:MAG: hypothetical protein ONA69_09840, partial [candidate division KSB1 bacterium]|nr:hypothetical protein [candidate division KSB1 bacterium]
NGFVAATEAAVKALCPQAEQVPLREHAVDLALTFGAKIEFVRGPAEQRLIAEMGGMAALLRW